MLIKITAKSGKFIGSWYIQESLINMSLQLYISYLNKHSHELYNISLLLLRSVNTLNSKLKFKTILINKSQLKKKALYLEATLTFLRFAAKQCSIAQFDLIFGGSYQLYALYVAYSKLWRGKLFNRKRKPQTMSEKRHKINKFANYQNIKVRNSPALDRHVFVLSERLSFDHRL